MLYKIKPWAHQLEAIAAARGRNSLLIEFDPGIGKTLSLINILRELCTEHKRVLDILILAPLSVLDNWYREIEANCNELMISKTIVLIGSGKQKAQTLLNKDFSIFTLNYDALDSDEVIASIEKRKFDVLTLDEIQRIKDPSARTRAAKVRKLSKTIKYRYGLSGTLTPKSWVDLWSPLFVIAPEETHPNHVTWLRQNFVNVNAGKSWLPYPKWEPTAEGKKRIQATLEKYSVHAKKADCLDLPPLIKKTLYVELTPEQSKHYRELEKDFLTYLGSEACITTTAMTKGLRLQQVASGYLPLTTTDGEVEIIGSDKMALLKEQLQDLARDHKVIVWTCWKASYHQVADLCEALNLGFTMLTGETKQKYRQEAIDGFNNDPSVRVFISNPAAGGIGINLQAASISIHLNKSWNLEHYLQAAARNYRGGSEIHKSITEYHYVTKGTVEERVEEALQNKMSIGELIASMRGKIAV